MDNYIKLSITLEKYHYAAIIKNLVFKEYFVNVFLSPNSTGSRVVIKYHLSGLNFIPRVPNCFRIASKNWGSKSANPCQISEGYFTLFQMTSTTSWRWESSWVSCHRDSELPDPEEHRKLVLLSKDFDWRESLWRRGRCPGRRSRRGRPHPQGPHRPDCCWTWSGT